MAARPSTAGTTAASSATRIAHPKFQCRSIFKCQLDLEPERLVFFDETWASTNMARLRGGALKGERLRAAIPHGHWKTTTFVAGLRLSGMASPMVLDEPINRDAFQAYVDQILVPELNLGDVVIMDDLGSHKGQPYAPRSGRPARACSSCHPTVRTSIQSRTPFPSSKRICEWRPSEPLMVFGAGSETSSISSRRKIAQTSSPLQDMIRILVSRYSFIPGDC
ncbi:hypothetical protein MPC4_70096 [Methylocella tundrae]|uniref:Tc1-like transposase DDE domain-containing protein n=1 Tax=Methylocella tundrae TaxID=227605 RepID=A0A8B6MD07_METTU|nr:hypothetical protein MPC1_4880004 [Methylocella tundrae]VTZ52208.1 hypothetical protein MPC4_70096 [Methylocella tundrae]